MQTFEEYIYQSPDMKQEGNNPEITLKINA